jgi:hypothetical protein
MHPLVQDAPKVSFIDHDQPVETLATYRTNQPLAERVSLWAAHWCFQHRQNHRAHRAFESGGIGAVTVVNEKSLLTTCAMTSVCASEHNDLTTHDASHFESEC